MMSDTGLRAVFIGTGRQPSCPPDPGHPEGIDLDVSGGAARACTVQLSYPAPSVGAHLVTCGICGLRVVVTAAGRADDPRRVTVACRLKGAA